MLTTDRKANGKTKRLFGFSHLRRLWTRASGTPFLPPDRQKWQEVLVKLALLVGFALAVSLLTFPRSQFRPPAYKVGDIAESDIKATFDFLVEDQESTAKRQQEFLEESPLVFDLDERVVEEINARLHTAFEFMRQTIQDFQRESGNRNRELPFGQLYKHLLDKKAEFDRLLGVSLPTNVFYLLARNYFASQWEDVISQQINLVVSQGVFSEQSLTGNDRRRPIIVRRLPSWDEKVETNPQRFLNLEEAKKKVNLYCREAVELPSASRWAVCELAQALVVPNLALNRAETERRRQERLQEFRPVYFQIKRGEMLVREGERITPVHLLKLEAMQREQPPSRRFPRLLGTFFLTLILVTILYQIRRLYPKKAALRLSELGFLAATTLGLTLLNLGLIILGEALVRLSPLVAKNFLYYLPVSLGPVLVQIFLGLETAVLCTFLASALTAMLLEKPFLFFIYFTVGGLVGVWGARYCRNRWSLIRTGLAIGLANLGMVVALKVLDYPWRLWDVLLGAAFAFGGGLQVGVLATGVAPLLEVIFGLTSDIKLLELLNLERPILKQLMLVAPGTYHHSIIVGNMVEAAAEKIGANPLLAKAAAYYHDIGKIKKPAYFVENQLDGENKHEKLAPSMSSLILQAHVKDGVELARRNRVGQQIIDIIKQHHGTCFMAYFYNKAKQQAANPQQVNIDDYRYPGPKPQTKEAGLVMLADQVEAASKTLLDPTPARIQGVVQRIINNIFADGQLDECELTLKDLHEIAKSFIKILSGIFHHRIDYPQPADKAGDKKKAHEDLDRQPAEKDQGRLQRDQEKSREDLKRLGLS